MLLNLIWIRHHEGRFTSISDCAIFLSVFCHKQINSIFLHFVREFHLHEYLRGCFTVTSIREMKVIAVLAALALIYVKYI